MKLLHILLCGLSFATANSSVFKFRSRDLKTKLGITKNVEDFFRSQQPTTQTAVVVLENGSGASSEIVFKRAHVAEQKNLRSSHISAGDFTNFEKGAHGIAVTDCITQIAPGMPIFAFDLPKYGIFFTDFLTLQTEDRMNIGTNISLGGQKVINMSWGFGRDSAFFAWATFATIKPLVEAGNIVVQSLGNEGIDFSLHNDFILYLNRFLESLPAEQQERIFFVGGSLNLAEKDTGLNYFSQPPQEGYDHCLQKRVFYAPSKDVDATNEKGSVTKHTGTSFGAPFVSGTIAQFLSCGYSLHQVNEIMKNETNILNFATMVEKAKSLGEKKEEPDYSFQPHLEPFLEIINAKQKVEEVEMHIHGVIKNKEREIEKILDSDPMTTHSQIFHLALDIYNQDFLPFVLPHSLFWGKKEHEKRSYWGNKEDLKAILFIQKEIHKKCSELLVEQEIKRHEEEKKKEGMKKLEEQKTHQNFCNQRTDEVLVKEDEHKNRLYCRILSKRRAAEPKIELEISLGKIESLQNIVKNVLKDAAARNKDIKKYRVLFRKTK